MKIAQVTIKRCSLFARVDCSLSPCPQGPSSSSCDPFPRRLFHSFPFLTPQLSQPRSFLHLYDSLISSKDICFFLLTFFCKLLFSLKMAISYIQLLHKHHEKSRSLDVVKRDTSACTSFLFDLQNSYLTTTTQHPARVVSTSPQRWVKP